MFNRRLAWPQWVLFVGALPSTPGLPLCVGWQAGGRCIASISNCNQHQGFLVTASVRCLQAVCGFFYYFLFFLKVMRNKAAMLCMELP